MSLKENKLPSVEGCSALALEYPLDSAFILRKKHSIRRALLLKNERVVKRIALLGGSNTAEIKTILELFLLYIGIQPEFYESEFNRYYEEAVFENQKLREFQPEIIYIHTTNKNINGYPKITDTQEEINNLAQQEERKYKAIWSALSSYQCPIIQNNFEHPQQRILGNLDGYDPHGALHYINRLNALFADEAQHGTRFYLQDINYLAASLGLSRWFDEQLWYSARYALSYEAIPHLAKNLAAIIGALLGMSKKAMVLDLDNTCWGGTIGDDGLEGIDLGKETPLGEAYTHFQRYIKLLKERGVVLAVCSKNEIEQAKQGLTHPDSILAHNDFVAFEASWAPKHEALLKISQSLNLGLHSLVMVDDNPAERQIIQDNLPMVTVPDIGSDILFFIDHIDKNYYFETVTISSEDVQRNALYQTRALSSSQIEQFANYGDYLHSLNMEAEIGAFSSLYFDRITQLLNKTHQFNVTNKQYSLNEIRGLAQDANFISLYGRLKDYYAEHGLISVLIAHMQEGTCIIDAWVMSCRVFKRTMEHAMLDGLIAQCKKRGIVTIKCTHNPTAKNKAIAYLFEELGFKPIMNQSDVWGLSVNKYINNNHYIKVCYE